VCVCVCVCAHTRVHIGENGVTFSKACDRTKNLGHKGFFEVPSHSVHQLADEETTHDFHER
jgi:hypothetical protein